MNETARPNRIKEVRKARGITARELAGMLGVWEATIYRYESGDIALSQDVMHKLAAALGSTLDDLFPAPDEATV